MTLAYILLSFANESSTTKKEVVAEAKKPKSPEHNDEEEIERISETIEYEQSVNNTSSLTYTYLGGQSKGVPSSINAGSIQNFADAQDSNRDFTEVEVVEDELDNMEARIWAQFVRKNSDAPPVLASLANAKNFHATQPESGRKSEIV